jgi:hypothetical protein
VGLFYESFFVIKDGCEKIISIDIQLGLLGKMMDGAMFVYRKG